MACFGVVGVLIIALLFWMSFGFMLAAGLYASWSLINVGATASSQITVDLIGPFQTCIVNNQGNFDCLYVSTANFNPTNADVGCLTQQEISLVGTCGSTATIALLVLRISFIIFVVFQFFGALICTLAPCCVHSDTFTFRRAKLMAGLAELFQVIIVAMWCIMYQHYNNLITFLSTADVLSRSQSLGSYFWLAVVSCAFPIVASLIDCCTVFPEQEAPSIYVSNTGVPMQVQGKEGVFNNNPLAEGPGPGREGVPSQPLVYAI